MTLRSPVLAMLWELWRVTRSEIVWKLALPIGAGLAALAAGAAFAPDDPKASQDVNGLAAALALILIVIPHVVGWLSVARLNGGQPGFPLYLGYTRPVRTAVLVGLPLAYLTITAAAIYLASAFILRVASGHAFPLLPVAAWMAALTVLTLAASWSIRQRSLQIVATMAAVVYGWGKSVERLTAVEIPDTFDWPPHLWPALFDFPVTDYAWIALIAVASIGVTTVMVGRQRCGAEARVLGMPPIDRTPGSGLWQWLITLFRLPCPTSSATRAQVWFDLKSSGLPVLTIGVALATVILVLSAVSGPMDAAINADPDVHCPIGECFYWRAWPPLFAPLSLVAMLFLGANAFGIRRRQGRSYLSAFETSQAHGTGRVAVLKLLVKSACVLAALAVLLLSAWVSMPLLGDAVFIQMWGVPLNSQRAAVGAAVAAMKAYEQLALAVVAAGGVAVWVAAWAALGALRTRYPRHVTISALLLLFHGAALALLAAAGWRDIGPPIPIGAILQVTGWGLAAALVFATGYLGWRTFAERLITIPEASAIVVGTAAFAAAWLTALRVAGVSLPDVSPVTAVRMLSPALLPLTVGVLAPWSYSRIRHA